MFKDAQARLSFQPRINYIINKNHKLESYFDISLVSGVDNDGCSEAEVEALLDAFIYTVKRIATTLARKAWFELKDYEGARKHAINEFTLLVERKLVLEQE